MMKKRFYPIEKSRDLVRDSSNMAVINTNSAALKEAKLNKEKRISQVHELANLKKEFGEIKSTMNMILEILLQQQQQQKK